MYVKLNQVNHPLLCGGKPPAFTYEKSQAWSVLSPWWRAGGRDPVFLTWRRGGTTGGVGNWIGWAEQNAWVGCPKEILPKGR